MPPSSAPHSDPDAIAHHPWLGDFEDGGADEVPVPDMDLTVDQAHNREILAELAVGEAVPAEGCSPVLIGVDLVDQHGAAFAPVADLVRLLVADDVEALDISSTGTGAFHIAVSTVVSFH
jgi:hypothetical protein